MVNLKVRVQCSSCREKVDKAEAREVGKTASSSIYECFTCFKKKRAKQLGNEQLKYDLYCERCRYKFTSAKKICPYCNSDQHLEASKLSATDLLSL